MGIIEFTNNICKGGHKIFYIIIRGHYIVLQSMSISVAQNRSWSCSLGLVLAFLQDQDQEQDRLFLARPRPRLTVQDLRKNKTKLARLLRLAVRTKCRFREYRSSGIRLVTL
ncbi:unnamed protein product [Parnassius mnemosyne]|uniref:Ribosomal protein S15 n=1 Tax=Parnassius mnemosyne TaxID=213953 RepID=A0AAV1LLI3_9NEOP